MERYKYRSFFIEILIHMSKELKKLIESLVVEELKVAQEQKMLEEGFLQSIKSGVKLAGKLAYLQATKGPAAVSEELIGQLSSLIQKARQSKLSYAVADVLDDLELEVEKIKTTKQRYRDSRGRFAKSKEVQQTNKKI